MKILISGGTGFLGQALTKRFIKSGHEILVLTRTNSGREETDKLKFVEWDARSIESLLPILSGVDAVINLTGENIGQGLWTKTKKERIINSRVQAGESLSQAILDSPQKPVVFIQASGVGIYGTSNQKVFDEDSPTGSDFIANVAKKWESSSSRLDTAEIRRVIIRTAIILDKSTGTLPLMTLPFKLFVGGPLGNGRQMISWIHLEDYIRGIEFIMHNKEISGVVNFSAPKSYSNTDFGKIIGKVIRRPFWFPVPAFGLKLVLGEKSSLILDGQSVFPKKLLDHGFKFSHPDLEVALKDIYKK